MFFGKKNNGAKLGKYTRGKVKRNEYVSKFFGYKFRVPEGVVMLDEGTLERNSEPGNIYDMECQVQPGITAAVIYIPMEEPLPFINDEMIEFLASEGANKINAMNTGKHSTYLGICEFAGKKCTRSIIETTVNGRPYYSETYVHIEQYSQLMFAFNYTEYYNVDMLKDAFMPL